MLNEAFEEQFFMSDILSKFCKHVKDKDGFFTFLIDHHFIGYFNHDLLKRISQLAGDFSIKKYFE